MIGAIEKIGESSQSHFNAGFLTHLYLLRTDSLVYVHSPEPGSLSQPVSALGIQPASIITEFLLKPKTATLNESFSDTADGRVYNLSLSFPMKGSLPELTTWIHANPKRRYIILTRDTLGNCYMAGSFENGARISWSRQVTNVSLHQLGFNLVNWHPIQFIPTIDLEILFPHREFDYSFDLSFS